MARKVIRHRTGPRSKLNRLRLAVLGDLHYAAASAGSLRRIFASMRSYADALVLCGDLTDHGLPSEARALAEDVSSSLSLPVVAVLGNHDFEAGRQKEIAGIVAEAGITVLDGQPHELGNVGFVGVKGFCGGFGRSMLQPWGELAIKRFVRETVREARKLELGLAKLRVERRVAVLHYSPVHETVEGEPDEIIPYLGSSRLAEPINTFGVAAVVHGHAHRGKAVGRTTAGIPVYNCALPLLQAMDPEQPYALVEV